jgi:hypothetical protein
MEWKSKWSLSKYSIFLHSSNKYAYISWILGTRQNKCKKGNDKEYLIWYLFLNLYNFFDVYYIIWVLPNWLFMHGLYTLSLQVWNILIPIPHKIETLGFVLGKKTIVPILAIRLNSRWSCVKLTINLWF